MTGGLKQPSIFAVVYYQATVDSTHKLDPKGFVLTLYIAKSLGSRFREH